MNIYNKEYKKLLKPYSCKGSNKRTYYSEAIKNHSKNRYPDVIPYNQYRVVLSEEDNCSKFLDSDYINASYLPGRNGEKSYISAQAPLPHTFISFWLMIWQNNIKIVCMLTKFLEKRRVKAHCYWPGTVDDSVVFGDIKITLTSTTQEKDNLQLREFLLEKDDEQRTIYHLHYTEWPDMGIPKDTDTFLHLIRLVQDLRNDGDDGNILAHCSAGIGRAGTFIAVHSYLDHYFSGEEIEVFDLVNNMRKQRLGMVQTIEQYYFIHLVIKDYVSSFETKDDIYSNNFVDYTLPVCLDEEETYVPPSSNDIFDFIYHNGDCKSKSEPFDSLNDIPAYCIF
eukprot:TRINITY_DN16523_c0_g1_i1.p1 TRINITY_DN16523_c0_g1~~TRINITY_DN16523_c0_g1_i1.p1  ORF type:complete len:360 (-),score=74.38 TRINITY_DN16523_c0_g1_i1:111-1121(-)